MIKLVDVCTKLNCEHLCKYSAIQSLTKSNNYCEHCNIHYVLDVSISLLERALADNVPWARDTHKCIHLDYILKLNKLEGI